MLMQRWIVSLLKTCITENFLLLFISRFIFLLIRLLCWISTSIQMILFQGLNLDEILEKTERCGMTFEHLLTIPEQDDWVYSDGKSTTCIAFVLEMYKEAGVLGSMSSTIQVTEFTVSATLKANICYLLSLFCLLNLHVHIILRSH